MVQRFALNLVGGKNEAGLNVNAKGKILRYLDSKGLLGKVVPSTENNACDLILKVEDDYHIEFIQSNIAENAVATFLKDKARKGVNLRAELEYLGPEARDGKKSKSRKKWQQLKNERDDLEDKVSLLNGRIDSLEEGEQDLRKEIEEYGAVAKGLEELAREEGFSDGVSQAQDEHYQKGRTESLEELAPQQQNYETRIEELTNQLEAIKAEQESSEQFSEQYVRQEERITNLEMELSAAKKQLIQYEQDSPASVSSLLLKDHTRLKGQHARLKERYGVLEGRMETQKGEVQRAREQEDVWRRKTKSVGNSLQRANEREDEFKDEIDKLTDRQKEYETELQRKEYEIGTLRESAALSPSSDGDAQEMINSILQEKLGVQNELRVAQQNHNHLESKHVQMLKEVEELRQEKDEVEHERDTLSERLEAYDELGDFGDERAILRRIYSGKEAHFDTYSALFAKLERSGELIESLEAGEKDLFTYLKEELGGSVEHFSTLEDLESAFEDAFVEWEDTEFFKAKNFLYTLQKMKNLRETIILIEEQLERLGEEDPQYNALTKMIESNKEDLKHVEEYESKKEEHANLQGLMEAYTEAKADHQEIQRDYDKFMQLRPDEHNRVYMLSIEEERTFELYQGAPSELTKDEGESDYINHLDMCVLKALNGLIDDETQFPHQESRKLPNGGRVHIMTFGYDVDGEELAHEISKHISHLNLSVRLIEGTPKPREETQDVELSDVVEDDNVVAEDNIEEQESIETMVDEPVIEWDRMKEALFKLLYQRPGHHDAARNLYYVICKSLYGDDKDDDKKYRVAFSLMIRNKIVEEGVIRHEINGTVYELQRYKGRSWQLVAVEPEENLESISEEAAEMSCSQDLINQSINQGGPMRKVILSRLRQANGTGMNIDALYDHAVEQLPELVAECENLGEFRKRVRDCIYNIHSDRCSIPLEKDPEGNYRLIK